MGGPVPGCDFSIFPSSATLAATASTGNIVNVSAISTGGSCPWSATVDQTWVTLEGGGTGVGTSTLLYDVTANTGSVNRMATITIEGLPFLVTQLPGACTYSLSPLSNSVDNTAHTGQTIAVTTQSACPWVATCPDAWITLTTASGSGSGNVVYNIASNSGAGRNSTITVNGIAFTVTQAGTSCTYQITPQSATFPDSGGAGTFSVVTQMSCAWNATTTFPWITITSGSSGTGKGTVGYTVADNYGSALPRLGSISVTGGNTFMVSQLAGVGGGFAVSDPPQITCVNGTTRPMMRDRIRRQMGVTPPVDTLPLGVPGEPPMGQPTPTNAEINQAITDAIRWINARVGFSGSTAVNLSVPAYTGIGPQYLSLVGVGTGSGTNQFNIDAIQKAVWSPGQGQSLIPLFATDQQEQDRLQTNWDNQPASVPRYYLWTRNQVGVLPGAQTAGTLQLYVTEAVYNFCDDTDILNALPIDYEGILEEYAVLLLSTRRPQEPGAESRIQYLSAKTEQGITLIGQFFNDNTPQTQRSVGFYDMRRQYGKQRIRR
jgi:hypothetical protein